MSWQPCWYIDVQEVRVSGRYDVLRELTVHNALPETKVAQFGT